MTGNELVQAILALPEADRELTVHFQDIIGEEPTVDYLELDAGEDFKHQFGGPWSRPRRILLG